MWAYLDGEWIDKDRPAVTLENRGLTFADGLFEVLRTLRGRVLFLDAHYRRMAGSASVLGIPFEYGMEELRQVSEGLARRNGVDNGEIYWELTRGVDPHRDHRYPPAGTPSTFFALAFPLRPIDPANWTRGAAVHSYPDRRHGLCAHKTLNLLPNVLAKNHAWSRGGYDALMFREQDGVCRVTEGGSSNYFCVRGDEVVTPEPDNILAGITWLKVIDLTRTLGFRIVERALTLNEFRDASEAFLTSTVSGVMPIRRIDDAALPAPGPVTERIMEAWADLVEAEIERG